MLLPSPSDRSPTAHTVFATQGVLSSFMGVLIKPLENAMLNQQTEDDIVRTTTQLHRMQGWQGADRESTDGCRSRSS